MLVNFGYLFYRHFDSILTISKLLSFCNSDSMGKIFPPSDPCELGEARETLWSVGLSESSFSHDCWTQSPVKWQIWTLRFQYLSPIMSLLIKCNKIFSNNYPSDQRPVCQYPWASNSWPGKWTELNVLCLLRNLNLTLIFKSLGVTYLISPFCIHSH